MWRDLIFANEVIEKGIRKSINTGLVRINPDTQLIELSPMAYSVYYDGNWLFFGHNTSSRDCFTWHNIMFNCFENFVPEFCKLRCYKVVIKTRNFLDAMRFRNAVLAVPHVLGGLTPIFGKVGVDERDYTDGYFNGFIYCDGFEDAKEKYIAVRELLDNHVEDGKNIPAIIKRACTEFEREHGSTDQPFWQAVTKDEHYTQTLLEDIYEGIKASSVQADWLQNKIITRMAKWANTVGDKSWMEYFGCEDILTMKAVTYHQNLLVEGGEVKKLPVGGKKQSTKTEKKKLTVNKEKK